MAGLRTLVILLLKKKKIVNYKAQIEEFGDDFEGLLVWLQYLNFL
jgi:hypothetical protein